MEFAKYQKSLFQMPTKGRESVTALSQNVAPAAIRVWSICTQRRHMWTGMKSTCRPDSLMKNISDTKKCTRFKLERRRDQGIFKNRAVHSGGLWKGNLASGSYYLGQRRHVP